MKRKNMNRKSLLELILAVSLIFASGSFADILNVPDDFETIQAGIDAAEAGDTVLVRWGLYRENIDYCEKNITIGSRYIITGDEAYIAETILDGDSCDTVVRFRNIENAVLKGLTIQNGYSAFGGGIQCLESNPLITDCVIKNNIAHQNQGGSGGGIYCRGANVEIRNCIIASNSAASGGGIYCMQSNPSIQKSIIISNASIDGAGIYCNESSPRMTNCTISNNVSDWRGGGIWGYVGSRPLIVNSIIWSNIPQELYFYSGHAQNNLLVSYSNLMGGQDGISTNGNCNIEWRDGNIDEDHLFVDPDNGDYHLTAESPCIDAGDPDSDPAPDGTRADMGAYYFHQRDIAVEPTELHFEPIWWGEETVLPIEIRNEGGTPLHLIEIPIPLDMSAITVFPIGVFDPPIEIAPDSMFTLSCFFHPDSAVALSSQFVIISDDPDEPEVIITADGTVNVTEDIYQPVNFSLSSPFPNPFNSTTTIGYSLPTSGAVSLTAYDLSGREVARLVDGVQAAGTHEAVWVADGMASGVYVVKLDAGEKALMSKVVLVR